nr:hypothetical protein [Mesorhizobium sp. M00.F.Ca.ET.217.01.1.1]
MGDPYRIGRKVIEIAEADHHVGLRLLKIWCFVGGPQNDLDLWQQTLDLREPWCKPSRGKPRHAPDAQSSLSLGGAQTFGRADN